MNYISSLLVLHSYTFIINTYFARKNKKKSFHSLITDRLSVFCFFFTCIHVWSHNFADSFQQTLLLKEDANVNIPLLILLAGEDAAQTCGSAPLIGGWPPWFPRMISRCGLNQLQTPLTCILWVQPAPEGGRSAEGMGPGSTTLGVRKTVKDRLRALQAWLNLSQAQRSDWKQLHRLLITCLCPDGVIQLILAYKKEKKKKLTFLKLRPYG